MSHNDNNAERSASRHRPALWALAVAIGLAVVAFLMFSSMGGEEAETTATEMQAPGTSAPTAADPPVAAGAEQGTATAPERN